MKKIVLKITHLAVFLVILFSIKNIVSANSISSINMDIYVDNNGNAEVTEVWSCYTNQGTECYHPYYSLGNSKINNLRVSDNKGRSYEQVSSWDTDDTMSQKAYKCGINNIYNGVELCWGISNYGSNVYTVKYNISNFVSELTDSQMMYWTLVPYDFSNTIGSVKVKIHADKSFSREIPVWGYGNYGGLCYVDNGAIYMQSDGALDKSEYITFLAKFPKETFNTSNVLGKDFNYYFQMAEEGSTKYIKKEKSFFSKIVSFIAGIFAVLINFIVPIIIIIISSVAASSKKFGFKYGEAGKKIPKDVAYYRDIPCNGDIFRAYYIAYQYNIMKNKTDILGAIILKWLKAGIIRTEQRDGGKIFQKENTVIILGDNSNRQFENPNETELFHMMHVASKDGILENKEFEKWCKKSYEKILGWFDDILEGQRNKLIADGLITLEKGGVWGKKYTATQELKEEALKIAGLKRFLLEYTLIQERYAIEVELFEDYLIYAQLLGIAKQVSKQFKELYPDMIEQTNYGSYDSIIYINYCSSRGVSSANSARAAAESYNSGGGGFSSGGGGGGSFGGGGGRRRFSLK